jgi:hypothetical protein
MAFVLTSSLHSGGGCAYAAEEAAKRRARAKTANKLTDRIIPTKPLNETTWRVPTISQLPHGVSAETSARRRGRRESKTDFGIEDFLVLTDMIYNKHWSINKITHSFDKNSGEKSTIVLNKDGQTQELESSAEDFLRFAHQHQKIVNAKGEGKLAKIRDSGKYWNDIEKLVDIGGGKVGAAAKSLMAGEFKFSFNPYNGIRKIL